VSKTPLKAAGIVVPLPFIFLGGFIIGVIINFFLSYSDMAQFLDSAPWDCPTGCWDLVIRLSERNVQASQNTAYAVESKR
jgi:hypothetical protein